MQPKLFAAKRTAGPSVGLLRLRVVEPGTPRWSKPGELGRPTPPPWLAPLDGHGTATKLSLSKEVDLASQHSTPSSSPPPSPPPPSSPSVSAAISSHHRHHIIIIIIIIIIPIINTAVTQPYILGRTTPRGSRPGPTRHTRRARRPVGSEDHPTRHKQRRPRPERPSQRRAA